MTKILSPYAFAGEKAVKMLPETNESPELEFKVPPGSDLELPDSGTAVIQFTVLRETEDKESGTCTYRIRIDGVDKVKKAAKQPYTVKSAAEAMKEALDEGDDD